MKRFVTLLLVVSFFILNASGFCWSTLGYPSEDEMVSRALRTFFENAPRDRAYIMSLAAPGDEITEADIEIMLESNPDCCGFWRKENFDLPSPKALHRLLGVNRGEPVSIYYQYKAANGEIIVRDFSVFVSNCGCYLDLS